MNDQLNSCKISSCRDCGIKSKVNCRFKLSELWCFYLISLPPFIIGGVFTHHYNPRIFYIWLLIICSFFLVIEIRVLCSHCPHYKKSSIILHCWANYGAPKLWKHRPGPMNRIEKSILIVGFIVVWGYPVPFLFLAKSWIALTLYLLSTTLFFVVLKTKNCVKCINFSCPLNSVDFEIQTEFFKNNPEIKNHWENHLG